MIDDKGITQKERRAVLENDRLVRQDSTYFQQAQASIDDERGGRFASENKPTVTGSSPVSYPQQPKTSYWHRDVVGKEPLIDGRQEGNVTGYKIDKPDERE